MDFSFVLASSVHDMKNSLGMLITTLAAMTEKYPPQDTQQAKLLSTLEYEAARINTELIQLLALYRMDEQKLVFEVDEHHVLDIIEEQAARNDTLLGSRGIQLDIACDPDLVWYFDSEMIGGVINNLLVNCARYSRQRIRIGAAIENGYLVISVADDGSGYPDSMLRDAATATGMSFSSGSTRLGLVFARKVLEMHKSKDRCGYLRLSNGGDLGGGIVQLFLP
ncbi:HAMP domain-containing histidine kinase [Cellvibrio japonicus]|nr:HAMP domain-containing histidine kinase [Cellvibrio japonicus]QEI17734.1 HAMP domain-containing histidine kinase [Cellvibrio japonicus]QEI21308.1 HAMP domain-containing histidine kinase [Cellvibrio japonicus]